MPEWENNLRSTFGNRRVEVKKWQRNIGKFHNNLEKITGEKYEPKEKTLEEKILHVLKLHASDTIFDARIMQNHLYFFHQKTFNRSSISKVLKKLSTKDILLSNGNGIYRKAA